MAITKQKTFKALEGINADLLLPIYLELYARTVHESSSEEDRKIGEKVMAEALSSASDDEKKLLIADLIIQKPELLTEITNALDRAMISDKLLEIKQLLS